MSIRRRLLIILLCTLSGIWLFSATANYFDSRNEIEGLLDAQLKQSAEVLLALSLPELQDQRAVKSTTTLSVEDYPLPEQEAATKQYAKAVAFQVWLADSNLALRSANSPAIPLSTTTEGYSDTIIDQELWRIYSLRHKTLPILVQVGERYNIRDNLTSEITLRMLTPVLLTLPVLTLIIWYATDVAMRPLHRIANEVAMREADHLDLVDPCLAPDEARPLVHSLNTLLIRVQKAFDSERRFTADAAHELRTPLAAIKAQAQVAQKSQDNEERQQAVQKVINGVDNATRVVQQLLTLARIDPAAPVNMKQISLCHCAQKVLQELAPIALKNNIDISLSDNCGGMISGNADTLAILITNLIHNAINYTPQGGAVAVSVSPLADGVRLSVCDSGPGIPADEREKVMRRFYRGRDVTQSGSGLGLSIVARIAELHKARVALTEASLGGLQVDVIFPSTA